MVHGTKFKQQYHVNFPPFSVFSSFIREEARMRNDSSFATAASSIMPPKGETFSMKTVRTPITVHRTEVGNTEQRDEAKGLDNPKRQCPFHKKPHPLQKCRAFREKLLEERIAFLRENGICFRCCSSTSHQAKDCKAVVQCSECNSDKHLVALHGGPSWWPRTLADKTSYQLLRRAWRGGRGISSFFDRHLHAQVCGDSTTGKSCAKICLVYVYPKAQPGKRTTAYAILDDQSNRSLAGSSFFEMFDIADDTSPYTLRTCAGVSETAGRRARGLLWNRLTRGPVWLSLHLSSVINFLIIGQRSPHRQL